MIQALPLCRKPFLEIFNGLEYDPSAVRPWKRIRRKTDPGCCVTEENIQGVDKRPTREQPLQSLPAYENDLKLNLCLQR